MAKAEKALPTTASEDLSAAIVYEIDPIHDPRWAVLVEGNPRASVFHSANWLKALQAAYGYEAVALTTCPAGRPLSNGVVFCAIKSWLTGRRLVSLPFSDHCEPLTQSAEDLDRMLLRLESLVSEGKWKYVEIRPVSYELGRVAKLGIRNTYHLHRLDLRPSEHQLFDKFHQDCVQRKIHRAEREKLEYEDGASEDLLRKFYRLLVITRRRQHLPPQPLEWFRSLIAAFGKDLKIRVASKEGVPVASILTLSHKKTMTYKYGCSDAAYHRFGGTALLLWKTIQEAKGRGLQELDMGRADIDNKGLIVFKERWGASETLINYWTYPSAKLIPSNTWKKRLAGYVVSVAPDCALETAGRLFYRHIG
jgi:hypothetical protein